MVRPIKWQTETRSTIIPLKEFQGTAEYQRKKGRWLLRVTNTKTRRIVEKRFIISKQGETAIWKAKELAKEWEKENE